MRRIKRADHDNAGPDALSWTRKKPVSQGASTHGASTLLAIKCCLENMRWAVFLD